MAKESQQGKKVQEQNTSQEAPATEKDSTQVAIIASIIIFGLIAVGAIILQANDTANKEKAKSAKAAAEFKKEQDTIKKFQQDKICKNPTFYPVGYVQEAPNLSVRLVSVEDIVKTTTIAATDQAPQTSAEEKWVKVVYTVSNKTATTLNLKSSGFAYSFAEFLINDTLHDTNSDAVQKEYEIGKYRSVIDALQPYEVATFAYLVRPIGDIAISVGMSETTSSCFTGWKVR